MEILQEIGSYAGIAAILGLAVLSALYFSQARDVKRLREWAGRAPDREPSPAIPAQTRGVVAQPLAPKPASRPIPGGTPPPVPRPPGAQPATPAAASAAGAAPAVARGPEASDDPEAEDRDEIDVTAMDTVVHPPPAPLDGGEEAGDGADGAAAAGELDEGPDDPPADGDDAAGPQTGDHDAVASDSSGEGDDTGEWAPDGDAGERTGDYAALPGEPGQTGEHSTAEDTGEWRPEDEHADMDFTDEHDAVDPATPAASAARPPTPPRPYQRRGAPGAATGYARDRESVLPPYAEARPQGEAEEGERGGRRPILLVVAAMVAIAVVAFGVLQLTGGDDSGGGESGLSAGGTTGDGSGGGGGGGDAPPIDPSSVTVAVLNGTTVPGLAATVGDTIAGEGFQLGTVTNNFDQERAESVVLYAPGSEREAADVARRLDIPQREQIDAESQALAGDATVVVVAGADQNQ
jgi:hypothetical protein